MEPMVQPPRHPASAGVAGNDARGSGIDVVARCIGVVELREQRRQRPPAAAVEVVAVVSIDGLDFNPTFFWARRLHDFSNPPRIERRLWWTIQRQNARVLS